MKKLLSILIVLVMGFSMLPTGFITASAEQSGDYTYTVSNSQATITDYIGTGGDIVIPSTFGVNTVTKIGDWAFFNCTGLISVTIPNSVTTIGDGAFQNSRRLTTVAIPNSVTTIGNGVFYGCTGLTQINVDTANLSYSSLDGVLFNEDKTLLIQYPPGKTGDYIIPNTVNTIGYEAFVFCNGLTSVTIPNSLTTIGDGAFVDCSKLTQINVGTANPSYSSLDGVLFDNNKTALIQYPYGKTGDYIIPNIVTTIGSEAFAFCTGLTSVTIPDSVTTIGDKAFYSCTGLTQINVDTANLSYSSLDGVLFNEDKTLLIQYPCGKTGYYVIPDGVTAIVDFVFQKCTRLTSVTIPNSVTTIGFGAFYNCTGLMQINVDTANPSLSSLDGVLFNEDKTLLIQYPCGKTGNYVIPNSVITIGIWAFYLCTGLTSVTIPNSVTTIGDGAFIVCPGLTSLIIPNSVTTIESEAFAFCTGLKSVMIPNSVTTIRNFVFWNCTELKSVTIPNSVTTIEGYAFSGCNNFTILGIIGSYSEEYALLNNIPFVPLYKLASKNNTGCVVDYTSMLIYGLAPGVTSLNVYINIADGYVISYIPNGGFGTGTVANVIKDGEIIERYMIIIFGDVNDDANIDGNDAGLITEVENYNVSWDPTADASYIKAADVNGDGNVDSNDAGIMVEVENYNMTIDQTTGLAVLN